MTGAVLDSHLHVWDPREVEYPWLDESMSPLDRPLTVDDAFSDLGPLGVRSAILVQAADNLEESTLLVGLVEGVRVVGAVIWAPLSNPIRVDAMVAELAGDGRIVGIRADASSVAALASLRLVAAAGWTFDVLCDGPFDLARVAALSEAVPGLAMVIDHLGSPPLGGSDEERRAWKNQLVAAAQNPLVTAKVSGLYAPGAPRGRAEQIRPFIDDALGIFGPDRLMVGSDWPLSTLGAGLEANLAGVTAALVGLSSDDRARVDYGTAASFYGVGLEKEQN